MQKTNENNKKENFYYLIIKDLQIEHNYYKK